MNERIIFIQCEKGFYKEHLYGLAFFKMIDKEKWQKYLLELAHIQ